MLEVLNIALEESDKQAQAEAALKLGLLYNKEGERKNIKKSAEFLNSHFDLLRQGDKEKKQSQIDAARVNLGIVLANQKIESYKHLVLNDLQGLVSWKVHRDTKNLQWELGEKDTRSKDYDILSLQRLILERTSFKEA